MRVSRRFALCFSAFLLTAVVVLFVVQITRPPALAATGSEGSLQVIQGGKPGGFCPLRHTEVNADVSGFIARVVVSQEFANASTEKIEAVYTFPLPQDAAVDDMTIQVGTRTIRGLIKRREEAAKIYAEAIQQGKMAALLDQERPNIFTQTVGNIPPGSDVRVTISYLARLKYEDGSYEFVFPMVVGPRYIPGNIAIGQQGGGWSPDTNKVPDASKITPPVTQPGTRAGHDISLALKLDAGIPIQDLRSPSHDIDVQTTGATSAVVRLRSETEIPNRDFILRYAVAGSAIAEGLLTHTGSPSPSLATTSAAGVSASTNGYFTLVIQPPERVPDFDVAPKELVFVLDSSGSMNGFPEEKSKTLIDYAIDGLNPGDTFNVIKFSGATAVLFDEPVFPSAQNVERAKEFVNAQWGGGGTEMMKAIRAALVPSDSSEHVRIVVFLTDGFVGNDMAIISEIQKHPNARTFAYGIGSSVNRFLLDKMAEAGRGAVEYVSYKQDEKEAEAAAHHLYERLRAPLLTDISLDFGSLPVTDIYPRLIPDLFSAKPVIITGRYTAPAKGMIRLLAKRAGNPYTREIPVTFAAQEQSNDPLPSLWARGKIDDLMSQDWAGLQRGSMRDDLRQQITQLGLGYHLITQFTSFVAVEERVVTDGGQPKRIQVPVEVPEGVQYEQGWSGATQDKMTLNAKLASPMTAPMRSASGVVGGIGFGTGSGGGVGAGYGGGYGGGVYRVGGGVSAPIAISTPAPQYTEEARQANLNGSVVLSAIIGPNGKPANVNVTRSLGMGLDQKAVNAVRTWKFKPAMKDGHPVAVRLDIEVAFANGTATTTSTVAAANVSTTAPSKTTRPLDTKLHPRLVAAYDCWRAQPDKSRAKAACNLQSDKLLIDVILSADSAAALAQLKTIGFQPVAAQPRPRHLIGWLAVDQLAALADNSLVQFAAPASGDQHAKSP